MPVYLLTRRGDRVGHLKTLIVFSFNPQAAYHVMKAKICHGREGKWGGKGDPAESAVRGYHDLPFFSSLQGGETMPPNKTQQPSRKEER